MRVTLRSAGAGRGGRRGGGNMPWSRRSSRGAGNGGKCARVGTALNAGALLDYVLAAEGKGPTATAWERKSARSRGWRREALETAGNARSREAFGVRGETTNGWGRNKAAARESCFPGQNRLLARITVGAHEGCRGREKRGREQRICGSPFERMRSSAVSGRRESSTAGFPS